MAFLTGYFDESGKREQNSVVSFCGLVNSDWGEFDREWNSLLRRKGLSALHIAKDALKATPTQVALYQQFIQVILRTVEQAFAVAVDVKAFDGMHRAVKSALGDDPHYMAIATVLLDVIKYATVLPESLTMDVICDEDENKACGMYEAYRKYRNRNPESRNVLKSVAFADDSHYPQLQAADLFSWVTRAEAEHRFFGKPFGLRDLYREFNLKIPTRIVGIQSAFWDQSFIKQFEKPTKVQLAKLRR